MEEVILMKILYVLARPTEINSSASIRNLSTINGLVELGHEVTVISSKYDTKHPNYDKSLGSNAQKKIYIDLNAEQRINGIGRNTKILQPLRKIAYDYKMSKNIYGDYISFPKKIDKYIQLANESDLIISSSDPKVSHLFVEKLLEKVIKELPWIQIWGDPFLSDITSVNKNKTQIYNEEKRLLSKADKVVYVSPITNKNQKELYKESKDKMYFIPTPYVEEKKYQISANTKLHFLYTGDFNKKVRNIQPLVDYFDTVDHRLTIVGTGEANNIRKENIKTSGRLNYSELSELEKEADVLIFLANKSGGQIPGKIFQYSGTNKPILFINDGENSELLEDIFKEYKRYIFVDNNIKNISEVVNNAVLEEKFNTEYQIVKDFSSLSVAREIVDF